jgi:serine/threonine-protein kinase
MNIAPGARIGSYEVADLIGEGGMGTVYRARDSRLDRDVALKVIRRDLAVDADRVARFDREARLLAALNHANIATIHGLEYDGATRILVLELVQGDTLGERLRAGKLTVTESLAYGLQMAAGIGAAHDQGIIHRDLKPANIKITPSGTVKILDFGLAKALAIDSAAQAIAFSSTLTSDGTAQGAIVGTAAYMSPEQARGKEVDKRTDVWAFGCILYDMLTGRAAFGGDTLSDTIAAILTRDPDWSRLPDDVPASIKRLLRRCLQKDSSRRLRDIGDARLEIEDALGSSSDEEQRAQSVSVNLAAPAVARRSAMRVPLVAAGLLGAAVIGAASYAALRRDNPLPLRAAHFSIALPGNTRLDGLDFPAVALSPAETHIAFVATRGGSSQLFVRPLASLDAQPLEGTEHALSPFFSPDGNWIGFFASGKLKKIPLAGGPVTEIADAEIGFGGVWGVDNNIIFAPSNASPLMRVSADGGTPEAITTLDTAKGEFSHRWPDLLPDGKTVLFSAGTSGSWNDADIVLQRIGSDDRQTIVRGGSAPRYAASGHVLYVRAGILHALPFDAGSRRATGNALADVAEILGSMDGAAQISVSRDNTLLYVPASASASKRTLTWVDRTGRLQPLAAPPRAYCCPRLSTDDATIAVAIAENPVNVWAYDIARNQLDQMTFAGGSSPEWGSGRRLVFAANRGGPADLFSKSPDGVEERLTNGPTPRAPQDVMPDGGVLFVANDESGRDIGFVSPDRTVHQLLASSANEYAPALSPDGRWLAYVSDRTGTPEVFVAPFADLSRAVQVSKEGGSEPVWRRDGGELYFRNGASMMVASIRTQPALAVQSPRELFRGIYETGPAGRPAYDVSLDGARFLMVRPPDVTPAGRELRMILGWRPADERSK